MMAIQFQSRRFQSRVFRWHCRAVTCPPHPRQEPFQPTIQPTKSDVLYDLRVLRQPPHTCKSLKNLTRSDSHGGSHRFESYSAHHLSVYARSKIRSPGFLYVGVKVYAVCIAVRAAILGLQLHFLAAQAIPSGPLPVAMRPITERVFRSKTATQLSRLRAI